MPTTYGNANYRKKFDAFRIVDQSGYEPLKEAISCALKMRESADFIEKALDGDIKAETRAQLTVALTKTLPDQFFAWIKVAEFLYAKPKQIHVEGSLTLHTERLSEEIRDARTRAALRVV